MKKIPDTDRLQIHLNAFLNYPIKNTAKSKITMKNAGTLLSDACCMQDDGFVYIKNNITGYIGDEAVLYIPSVSGSVELELGPNTHTVIVPEHSKIQSLGLTGNGLQSIEILAGNKLSQVGIVSDSIRSINIHPSTKVQTVLFGKVKHLENLILPNVDRCELSQYYIPQSELREFVFNGSQLNFPFYDFHYANFSNFNLSSDAISCMITKHINKSHDINNDWETFMQCFEENDAPGSWYRVLYDKLLDDSKFNTESRAILLQRLHELGVNLAPDFDLD